MNTHIEYRIECLQMAIAVHQIEGSDHTADAVLKTAQIFVQFLENKTVQPDVSHPLSK